MERLEQDYSRLIKESMRKEGKGRPFDGDPTRIFRPQDKPFSPEGKPALEARLEFGELVTDAGVEILKGTKLPPDRRLFNVIADALERGEMKATDVVQYMQVKHGMTNIEIAEAFRQSKSFAGKELQQLSAAQKKLKEILDPEVAKVLDEINRLTDGGGFINAITHIYRKANNTRRVMMTSQPVTTVRNMQVAGVAGAFSVFEQFFVANMAGLAKGIKGRSVKPWTEEMGAIQQGAKSILGVGGKRDPLFNLLETTDTIHQQLLFKGRKPQADGTFTGGVIAELYGDM